MPTSWTQRSTTRPLRARTSRREAVAVAGALFAAGALPAIADERAGNAAELPRGGTSVHPQHRVIGFYGAPQADSLGELGIGSPASAAKRLRRQAKPYKRRSPQPILPV